MRLARTLLFVALLPTLAFAAACSGAPTEDVDTSDVAADEAELTTVTLDAQEQAFFTKINQYRASHGLAKLRLSPALTRASIAHSKDMAAHGVLAHDSSDGTPWDRRIRKYYTINTTIGENVAFGYDTGAEVFAGWKASPPHDKNMLLGSFHAIGIARVVDKNGTAWWTTDFGGK